MDANDVIFTTGLMKAQTVRSVMMASWQGVVVRKIDDFTVQFVLPASYAAFPQALTFAILPQHVLKDADQTSLRENAFSNSPVGSGPFKLRLLQNINIAQGRKVVHMDANRNYYDGSPRLDHIQLHTYVDDESMGRALRTGEVSAASNVSSNTAESIDDNRYEAIVRPVNSGVYAMFNLAQPALKDANVRKALQVGTDTTALRKQLYGNPQPLHLPFVNGQVNGLDSIPAPKPDKNAAKQILDHGGWVMTNGVRTKDGQPLRLRMVARKNTDYEVALQSLAGQWRALGVEVDAQVVDGSDFTQEVLHDRNYDVLVDELVIGGDPDVFAYWHSRGLLNFTGYASQVGDDALSSARTTSNQALRAVKYVSFAKQWLSDVPAIGLYQSNFIYMHTTASHAIGQDEVVVSPDDHYTSVRYWTAELGNVYKTP
jgi:peptide/nickel transport system substrate-binding protein